MGKLRLRGLELKLLSRGQRRRAHTGSSWGAGPAVAPEMANAEERVTRGPAGCRAVHVGAERAPEGRCPLRPAGA